MDDYRDKNLGSASHISWRGIDGEKERKEKKTKETETTFSSFKK